MSGLLARRVLRVPRLVHEHTASSREGDVAPIVGGVRAAGQESVQPKGECRVIVVRLYTRRNVERSELQAALIDLADLRHKRLQLDSEERGTDQPFQDLPRRAAVEPPTRAVDPGRVGQGK